MKNSKRLLRILESTTQTTPLITFANFFASYLKEDRIIQKEVRHHLLQTNAEAMLMDILRSIDDGSKVSIYKSGVYIAQEQGRLCGFSCYRKLDGYRAIVGPMGVRKDYRDSGYGRSLVLTVLQHLNKLGFRKVINSQAGPIEFYERFLPLKLYVKEKG